MIGEQDIQSVKTWLMGLQDSICAGIEELDGEARFMRSELPGERGGIARPRVLEGGKIIEKAAVNFSHALGERLPPAATAERPELAGCAFQAVSTSLIIHPRNPNAPTSHANFRLFVAQREGQTKTWWFGGGFDLTPYYPYEDDARDWHKVAADAREPFGAQIYPRFKEACDKYFYLPHRKEARGIGGIFFDDFNEIGFEQSFALTRSCGDAFLKAYLPVAQRRVGMPYGDEQRQWQLYRRGRYVEFNPVYDRGTKYGLQSGSRIESILASMPPLARWQYDYHPEAGSPEAQLYEHIKARDWLQS